MKEREQRCGRNDEGQIGPFAAFTSKRGRRRGSLRRVREEKLGGSEGGYVGPEPAHRISRGVMIRQQAARSILYKTTLSAYSH